MQTRNTNKWLWGINKFRLILILLSLMALTACSATFHPYNSSFKCPAGYEGLCENMADSYYDSVHGIDPRKFDKDWLEKKQG